MRTPEAADPPPKPFCDHSMTLGFRNTRQEKFIGNDAARFEG
jgi:hypothetical protein